MGWALIGLVGSPLGLCGPTQGPSIRLMNWFCIFSCYFISLE